MKKKKNIGLAVFGLVLLLLAISFYHTMHREKVEGVLKINDYIVTEEEYDFFSKQCKATVVSDFFSMYGIDVSYQAKAWDIPNQEGETAAQRLSKVTKDALVRYVTVKTMAQERGIDVPGSFLELQKQMNQEQSSDKNQLGYGIDTWNMVSYFSYLYNDIERKLLIYMGENEYTFREDEIREQFQKMDKNNSAMRGRLDAVVNLYCYDQMQWGAISPDHSLLRMIEQLKENQEIRLTMADETIEEKLNESISTETVGRDDVFTQLLLKELYERKEGEVFLTTLENVVCVCQLLEKEVTEDDFEDQRDKAYNDLVRNRFEKEIETQMNLAKVISLTTR